MKDVERTMKKTIVFRMNSVDTEFWYDDLCYIISRVGEKIDCVIVPKVNRSTDIEPVDKVLKDLEEDNGIVDPIGLETIIETVSGLKCGDIAFSSKRLESFIFWPGHYAANLDIPSLVIGGFTEDYPGICGIILSSR